MSIEDHEYRHATTLRITCNLKEPTIRQSPAIRRPEGAVHYGTWIRTNRIVMFAGATVVCIAAMFFVGWPWMLPVAMLALPLGYITGVVALTAWQFSASGGRVQQRIHALMASTIAPTPGDQILDVGCGSGALVVALAKIQPEACITGVDSWGSDWQYSQRQAQVNAQIEGVDQRVTFVRHSASRLPYKAEFDALVSCLTFHEVRDAPTATEVVIGSIEALRAGGRFVLLDLFGSTKHYPSIRELIEAIEDSGASVQTATPLRNRLHLPFPLRKRQALGDAIVITGTRTESRPVG